MFRTLLLSLACLPAVASAQSSSLGVTGTVMVDVTPAEKWDVGLRLVAGTPVLFGARCTPSENGCRGAWPSAAPEVAVGFPLSGGIYLDLSMGFGLATAAVSDAGWLPHAQVMPQVGLRLSTVHPIEPWFGGYVTKSWSSRFASNEQGVGASEGSPVSVRLSVQIPWSDESLGAARVGVGVGVQAPVGVVRRDVLLH